MCFGMGLFFMAIPFSTGLWSLCIASVTAEFFMGLIDTGCNVSILKIWSENQAPFYFTCLHFCFGIGNLLGPVMAEIVLTDGVKNETSLFKIEAHEETDFGPSHIEEDVWSTLIRSLGLSQLQILHIIVFGKLLMNTLMFVICSVVKDENQDILEEDASKKEDFDRKLLDHSYGAFKLGFIAFMTMTFATTNGINFAYSNFVTKFAVNSELSLNKSQGARITAIYFGCSAITKFVTIGMLKIFKPIRLIVLNVILLAIASVILLLFANESLLAYQSGTALAGKLFQKFRETDFFFKIDIFTIFFFFCRYWNKHIIFKWCPMDAISIGIRKSSDGHVTHCNHHWCSSGQNSCSGLDRHLSNVLNVDIPNLHNWHFNFFLFRKSYHNCCHLCYSKRYS